MITTKGLNKILSSLSTLEVTLQYFNDLCIIEKEELFRVLSIVYKDLDLDSLTLEQAVTDYKRTIKKDRVIANACLLKYLLVLDKKGIDTTSLINTVREIHNEKHMESVAIPLKEKQSSDLISRTRDVVSLDEINNLLNTYKSSLLAEVKVMLGDLSGSPVTKEDKDKALDKVMENVVKTTKAMIMEEEEEEEYDTEEYEEPEPEPEPPKYIPEARFSSKDFLRILLLRTILLLASIFICFLFSFFGLVTYISIASLLTLINGPAMAYLFIRFLKPEYNSNIKMIGINSLNFSIFFILSIAISYHVASIVFIPIFLVASHFLLILLIKPTENYDITSAVVDAYNTRREERKLRKREIQEYEEPRRTNYKEDNYEDRRQARRRY